MLFDHKWCKIEYISYKFWEIPDDFIQENYNIVYNGVIIHIGRN